MDNLSKPQLPTESDVSASEIKSNAEAELVELHSAKLINLLAGELSNTRCRLRIPDYQRTYCWEEKNVIRLLNDIKHHSHNDYHMGSIILHARQDGDRCNIYDVVDGQQRLVTLALLLLQLGKDDIQLLSERFESEIAQQYIAHNKWLIENYIAKEDFDIQQILENLCFSVLILNSRNLDLAYTFFTSENGKGKALSDYDLLKSHHLRFIQIQEQAEHLAERWDSIIRESENDNTANQLGRTFEIYLFRLRKWMRKKEWNNDSKRKVKNEFEASPMIPNIPPFGEQFHFYESIQGGTHFFAFAEHFIQRYNEYSYTFAYKVLHQHLNSEKHWWYRDAIEALLFGYFLKFGQLYMNEACILITRLISDHRYVKFRAYLNSVLEYAANTEIIMMIDQATSPTFFLAEIDAKVKRLPKYDTLKGTRERYNKGMRGIETMLMNSCSITF